MTESLEILKIVSAFATTKLVIDEAGKAYDSKDTNRYARLQYYLDFKLKQKSSKKKRK